ncbi:GH1 family beta-glucosidase [Uliginosibacterium gangwonense]|uniref:GH1 family beta-glucosidase n=1 Tax=Uliginosibacterium gangwonense TaxID=392736 RepID=UPI001FE14897|nr:GH1 family beta-glucosidase [Uliginosibacterium gangwonense]
MRSSFPSDFAWGTATSAYQIEGAAQEDGKGVSIWDRFSHQPGAIEDGSTGDVACDHYHRLESDLDLLVKLGINAYRFSIAWPRVQPLGQGAWNPQGLDFYDRLVDGLLQRGITPHATLYHWDLPQTLQDMGGWANRDTCQYFAEYARTIATRLGDRVKAFATHNEPFVSAMLGNLMGIHAPGLKDAKTASQIAHHILLSHGMAVRAMRAATKADLGIVLNLSPTTPATSSQADQDKAEQEFAFVSRWYLDPLFRGTYPSTPAPIPLPDVQTGDMALIQQPIDFLGINYYFRDWCSTDTPPIPAPCKQGCSEMGWEIYPEGIYELLTKINREYKLPALYISENGVACADSIADDGLVHDAQRIRFIEDHLHELKRAIAEGVDVRGYFYWSLMDNFEWSKGFAMRFGLIHIDYPTQQRTFKDSALWYRDYIQRERFGAQQKEATL